MPQLCGARAVTAVQAAALSLIMCNKHPGQTSSAKDIVQLHHSFRMGVVVEFQALQSSTS
jgi:hypothetical protein